jgi:hypothetical protein
MKYTKVTANVFTIVFAILSLLQLFIVFQEQKLRDVPPLDDTFNVIPFHHQLEILVYLIVLTIMYAVLGKDKWKYWLLIAVSIIAVGRLFIVNDFTLIELILCCLCVITVVRFLDARNKSAVS